MLGKASGWSKVFAGSYLEDETGDFKTLLTGK
jgi:hypothetical protein